MKNCSRCQSPIDWEIMLASKSKIKLFKYKKRKCQVPLSLGACKKKRVKRTEVRKKKRGRGRDIEVNRSKSGGDVALVFSQRDRFCFALSCASFLGAFRGLSLSVPSPKGSNGHVQGHAHAQCGEREPLRPRAKRKKRRIVGGENFFVFVVAHVLPLPRLRRRRRLPQLQLGAGRRREGALVRSCPSPERGRQADAGARRGAPPRWRRLGRHQGQGEKRLSGRVTAPLLFVSKEALLLTPRGDARGQGGPRMSKRKGENAEKRERKRRRWRMSSGSNRQNEKKPSRWPAAALFFLPLNPDHFSLSLSLSLPPSLLPPPAPPSLPPQKKTGI